MDYILYIDDYPVEMLCNERDIVSFLKGSSSVSGIEWVRQLMEQKIVIFDEVPDLLENLKDLRNLPDLNKYKWLADEIIDLIEDAEIERCVYIRKKEMDLRSFLEDEAWAWEKNYRENPQDEVSMAEVVKGYFDELEFHGLIIDDDSSSFTVVEMLWAEVLDYWGGICWYHAELCLNNTDEYPREQRKDLDFRDLVEMIYWACKEKS